MPTRFLRYGLCSIWFLIWLGCLGLVSDTGAGVNSWTSHGPIARLTPATPLALDPLTPTTLYFGTSQGMFKTTDGGDSWFPINNGLSDLSFLSAVVVDPLTPTTVYTYTGALFKSTDGGGSWTLISEDLPPFPITALRIDPLTPTTLYATTIVEVFKSTNGGVNWTPINQGLPVFGLLLLSDISIDPLLPSTLYLASSEGIFKSTDGGENWLPMVPGTPMADTLRIDPVTPTTLYAGTRTGVFKSLDAGVSWRPMNAGLSNPFILTITLDPNLQASLYLGTENGGIFQSTDAGANWTPISNGLPDFATVSAVAVDPLLPTTLYASVSASGSRLSLFGLRLDIGVFKSTDAGQSWRPINTGLGTPASILSLALDPTSPSTVYAGSDDGMFTSTDAGASWRPTIITDNVSFRLSSASSVVVDPLTPTTLYALSDRVAKSTDSGGIWTMASDGLTSQPLSLAIDPLTPSTLYTGTRRDGVFKSVDGGMQWAPSNTGLPESASTPVLSIDPLTPTTLYAGTSAGVFKSIDAATSWTSMSSGLPSLQLLALLVDPLTPTTLYAGLDQNGIAKSTDGGATWEQISTGLPEISSVRALAIDPLNPTVVYAGIDDTVFQSINAGASWTRFGQPLPGGQVSALALDSASLTLYAGTAEGVFDFQLVPEMLDNPQDGSFQSGIGVISGWVCDAETISIEIDGALIFAAAYGTSREDTLSICGDRNNGFGVLVNWNGFGDGTHEIRALSDGQEFGRATVTVTTLGTEFLTGASGSFTLSDFPQAGTDVVIAWQETLQNFAIADLQTASLLAAPTSQIDMQALSMGVLENPQANSFHSGIGVISGWLCEADQVEIEIDGLVFEAAYGTSREDTQVICGDANNGFGLLVNWNLFGDGPHEVRALVDGEELGRASVEVTTFGQEFLTGVAGNFTTPDFPQPGSSVEVEWQEALQNFVITDFQSATE